MSGPKEEKSGLESAETLAAAPVTQRSASTDRGSSPSSDGAEETLPAAGSLPPQRTSEPGSLPLVDGEHYEILGEHARGGLGRILRARDRRLERPVAIKELLRADVDDERRFAREAFVTARLQHPAIVPVYEAGRWPSGAPFFAMKLVSGRSLEEVIRETMDLGERLALLPHVIDVVEALAYAHEHRIIHRDLKPANVLVGAYGETVVIDWGLAKDLSDPGAASGGGESLKRQAPEDSQGQTMEGSVMGTPAYMPPEQAHGVPVDERADVYALGAVLYHVLCGEPPYLGRSSAEVLLQVTAGPPIPLHERQAGIPQDLLTIVRKAMAYEPERRYPTAKELADDLNRFQRGQLVTAHAYSTLTLLRRWLRRHRAPVAVAAFMAGLLALAGVLGVKRIVRERDAATVDRELAQQSERRANMQADELAIVQARLSLDEHPSRALDWLRRLTPQFTGWGEARVIAADALSRGVPSAVLRLDEPARGIRWSPDGKYLAATSSTADGRVVSLWEPATDRVVKTSRLRTDSAAFAFEPGDLKIYLGGQDGSIKVWSNLSVSLQTGKAALPPYLRETERRRHTRDLTTIAFCTETKHKGWFATGSVDGTVRLWDRSEGGYQLVDPGRATTEPTPVSAIAFSPRDPLLVVTRGGEASIWEFDHAHRAHLVAYGHQGNVTSAAFDATGRWLVTATDTGQVMILDLDKRPFAPVDHSPEGELRSPVTAIALTPAESADNRLVVAGQNGQLVLWDLGAPRLMPQPIGAHDGRVTSLEFSPDGKLLASGGVDDEARLWDLRAGGDSRILRAHAGDVTQVAFSPDGRRLATAGADGAVLLWHLSTWEGAVYRDAVAVLAIVWRADSRDLAFATESGKVGLWNLRKGTSRALHERHERVSGLAWTRDGSRLASSGWDNLVRVWDQGGTKVVATLPNDATAVAWSPDGALLAYAGGDGTLAIAELASGRVSPLVGAGGESAKRVTAIAFSPDGERLVSAAADDTVRLWDVGALAPVGGAQPAAAVVDLAFSPDGVHVAWASANDWTLTIWDTETNERQTLREHGDAPRDLAFSPDGALLASAGADRKVIVWRVATGVPLHVLSGHDQGVNQVEFSPDGRSLASAGDDDRIRLWDVHSGQGRVLRLSGAATAVAYSPDGQWVAAAARDGSVRIFPDNLPTGGELRAWLESMEMLDKTGRTH